MAEDACSKIGAQLYVVPCLGCTMVVVRNQFRDMRENERGGKTGTWPVHYFNAQKLSCEIVREECTLSVQCTTRYTNRDEPLGIHKCLSYLKIRKLEERELVGSLKTDYISNQHDALET